MIEPGTVLRRNSVVFLGQDRTPVKFLKWDKKDADLAQVECWDPGSKAVKKDLVHCADLFLGR